jgi:uncharacterized protein YjbI with pentapeptide repeats
MRVLNNTHLQIVWFVGRPRPPQFSVSLVIKGSYKLSAGGVADVIASTESARPTGDLYVGNEGETSLRYSSDFALFKPRADVILVGSCHVPDGVPTKTSRVRFAAGEIRKTVTVIGDRHWHKTAEGIRATEPMPFTTMPLADEYSFGGPSFDSNPLGKGFEPKEQTDGRKTWALPNLEDPRHLINSPDDRPMPVGLGPLPVTSPQRQTQMGTYDDVWLQQRWPGFPADFDWGHFNAAHRDQQIEGYLQGDESLHIENMHPQHAIYQCQLPGVRPRVFLNRQRSDNAKFAEVALNLDTLWVDMDAEVINLVWRGRVSVKSPEHEELKDVLLAVERLDEPPETVDHYHRQLLESTTVAAMGDDLHERKSPVIPVDMQPDEESKLSTTAVGKSSKGTVPNDALDEDSAIEVEHKKLLNQARADLDKAGFSTAILDAVSFENDPSIGGLDEEIAPDEELTKLLEQSKTELVRSGVPEALLSSLSLGGDTTVFMSGILKQFGIQAVDAEKYIAEALSKSKQQLIDTGLDPSILDELEALSVQDSERDSVDAIGKDAEPKSPREKISEDILTKKDFSGEDFSGADFSGLSLGGVDFSNAILASANFSNAQLDGANFVGANLAGADFSKAQLDGAQLGAADLEGAKLTGASVKRASMKGANFSDATLEDANLVSADAEGAFFDSANLTNAALQFGMFNGVSFQGACLDRVKANGASFRQASFVAAKGRAANLSGCDLTELRAGEGCDLEGSNLSQTKADGSLWQDANLSNCDLSYASLARADFSRATLDQANLHAIDASQAIFIKASLKQARVTQANLFESLFERAHLQGTNFSGSNLYGSEFWDAVLDGTVLTGTNVMMTKLATDEAK